MPEEPRQPHLIVLSRYLAMAGVAARRAAGEQIRSGAVAVNGIVEKDPARRIAPETDVVEYRGKRLRLRPKCYIMLHKPRGYVCSARDPHATRLALDLLPPEIRAEGVFTVGRLDKDSEGLLLVTNDGDLAHRISHPSFEIEKEYSVSVRGDLRDADLKCLLRGIRDDGDLLRARAATVAARNQDGARLTIVVAEGKNREIRRMCRHLGLYVRRLQRRRIGPLTLDALPPGSWRHLSQKEHDALTPPPEIAACI